MAREDSEQKEGDPNELGLTRTEPEGCLYTGAADTLHQNPRAKRETEASTLIFILDPRRIAKEAYQEKQTTSTGRINHPIISRCRLQRLGLAGNS